jgi:hypothetical protein
MKVNTVVPASTPGVPKPNNVAAPAALIVSFGPAKTVPGLATVMEFLPADISIVADPETVIVEFADVRATEPGKVEIPLPERNVTAPTDPKNEVNPGVPPLVPVQLFGMLEPETVVPLIVILILIRADQPARIATAAPVAISTSGKAPTLKRSCGATVFLRKSCDVVTAVELTRIFWIFRRPERV